MPNRLAHLPWLFYTPTQKNEGLSSGSVFSPVHAVGDENAWQSTTTPDARQSEKTIILTQNSFYEHPVDLFALAQGLRHENFTVYLCLSGDKKQGNEFHLFEGSKEDIRKLSKLSLFNEKRDYETLAKYVSRDSTVVLDTKKGEAIKDCLEKPTTPDPTSNAISTATTLRFHAYPEKINNPADLLVHMKAALTQENKESLFDKHQEIISKASEQDFKNILLCIGVKVGWKKFTEMLGEEIRIDITGLKIWLSVWPARDDTLWEFYRKNSGESLSEAELIEGLKAWPTKAEELWEKYIKANDTLSTFKLAECLKAWPEGAEKLWEYFKMNETDRFDYFHLPECLKAWPKGSDKIWIYFKEKNEIISKELLTFKLSTWLNSWPEEADKLWEYFKENNDSLPDHTLAGSLKAWPEGADKLWEYFTEKNSNLSESNLHICLNVWPKGANKIFEYFKTKDTLSDFKLVTCLQYWPEGADSLWKYFKEKNGYLSVSELTECLKAWPEGANKLWEYFKKKDYLRDYSLGDCLAAWPTDDNTLWEFTKQRNPSIEELSYILSSWPAGEQKIVAYCKEKKCEYPFVSPEKFEEKSDMEDEEYPSLMGANLLKYQQFLLAIKIWPENIKQITLDHAEFFLGSDHHNTSLNKLIEEYPSLSAILLDFLEESPSDEEYTPMAGGYLLKTLCENNLATAERYFPLTHFPDNLSSEYPALAETEENFTRLYLGSMHPNIVNEANSFIERHSHSLKKLSIIEIANCSEDQIILLYNFLGKFKSKEPIQVFLPKSLERRIDIADLPKNLIIHFAKAKTTIQPEFRSEITHAFSSDNREYDSDFDDQEVKQLAQRANSSILFIANNGLSADFGKDDKEGSFDMVQAGEFLNSDGSRLRLRTGIISLDFNNLTQKYVQPNLSVINVNKYENEADFKQYVEQCRTEKATNARYCKFTQSLSPKKRTRLLSIDSAEKFEALFCEPSSNVRIEKGDDDFYYATADEACTIHYVLKADPDTTLKEAYADIPNDYLPKRIVEDFKNSPEYKEVGASNQEIPETTDGGIDWEAIYKGCIGACRHRVASVYKKIVEDPEYKKDDIRIAFIDNNHVCLEIKDSNGRYLQVDLGGSDADLIYANSTNPYHAAPDPDPSQIQPIPTTQSLIKPSTTEATPTTLKPTDQKENKNSSPLKEKMLFLENKEALLKKTIFATTRKILLATGSAKQLEIQANLLLQEARKSGRPVFYLNSPAAIDIGVEKVWLDEKGQPRLGVHSSFRDFLEKKDGLLLINWEAFSTQQRLQLNSLLDKKPRVKGQFVDQSLQIISLCHSISTDPSFTSRHRAILNSERVLVSQEQTLEQDEKKDILKSIDLEGYSDWEEKLFGKITQTPEGMVWKKSEFVLLLEKKDPVVLEIKNASNSTALLKLLNLGKSLKRFSYKDYIIDLPDTIQIHCNAKPFDFSEFNPIAVQEDITSDDVLSTTPIIDTHVFDALLVGKKIANSCYKEKKGLIQKSAKKPLTLFLTSTLTEAQYYSLYATANKYQVKLTLQLAPGVILPKKCPSIKVNLSEPQEQKNSSLPFVYFTQNPDAIEKKLCAESKKPLVLHVEDYTFSDLFFNIKYEKTDSGFKNFDVIKSEVLTELGKGRDVILRGEFSDALLAELKPLLLGRPVELPTGESIKLEGKLKLILEPKNSLNMRWLSNHALFHDTENKAIPKEEPRILYKEDPPKEEINLQTSEKEATDFIEKRKHHVLTSLEKNSMIQLIGESGVGKSHLFSDLKKEGKCQIYNELSSFDDWASNKKPGMKILFIDEANIENKHLTLFAPLKKGSDGAEILYKGKLYTLTSGHKVVFARNPHSYGGGRAQQNLFNDNKIPEIHFSDFPDSYIYERILKPVLAASNIASVNLYKLNFFRYALESVGKEKAVELINNYKKANKKDTVRELQEELLKYCKIQPQSCLPEEKNPNAFSGTPTAQQSKIIKSITTFINIRKSRRTRNSSGLNGMGLNGYLLEGKPATGKSEMIAHALGASGYLEAKPEDEPKDGYFYYKIDASLSLADKKKIIIRAFDEGNAIWIDELNSCIDDGLEKILNAVLTGENPDTKQKTKKQGFMAFFTANSAGLEGRSLIGPAIRHRCVQKETGDFLEKDLPAIFQKEFSGDPIEKTTQMAEEFFNWQKEGNWDLRSYLEHIKQEKDSDLADATTILAKTLVPEIEMPVLEEFNNLPAPSSHFKSFLDEDTASHNTLVSLQA